MNGVRVPLCIMHSRWMGMGMLRLSCSKITTHRAVQIFKGANTESSSCTIYYSKYVKSKWGLISADVGVMGSMKSILMRLAYLITRQYNNRKLEVCLLMLIAYFNQADIKTINFCEVSGQNHLLLKLKRGTMHTIIISDVFIIYKSSRCVCAVFNSIYTKVVHCTRIHTPNGSYKTITLTFMFWALD